MNKKKSKNKAQPSNKKGRKTPFKITVGSRSVKGSGDYEVNPTINQIVKSLGGLGSSYLGLGSNVGSNLADSAHRAFKAVTGYGEYKVKGNTLATDNGAPIFKPQDRVMHIRHREFISNILSGTVSGTASAFNSTVMPIHPSNAKMFPWLATIAKQFQQYRFKGLLFSFESKSGNAVSTTNSALGTVIMATQYNIQPSIITGNYLFLDQFHNKQQMEAHEFCTSSTPTGNMIHPIECAPSEQLIPHFNVVTRPLLPGIDDPKFYIPGVFQVSTEGMQGTATNLGELWVSYDIELLKTRMDGSKQNFHSVFTGNLNGGRFPPTQVSKLGAYTGFASVNPTTGVITMDPGFYGSIRVTYLLLSPAAAVTSSPSLTIGGNLTADSDLNNDANSINGASNTSQVILVGTYYCNGGGTLTISNSYCTTDTGTIGDLFIDTIPDDAGL